MQDYEKLGSFYLGREYDLSAGARGEGLVLYDSKDLVTHAVCVGMTGSGKTGLCIGLLEEAAIDSIPAIVIDPKGDLANLLLTFPGLSGAEFEPWVNAEEARQKGMSPGELAAAQAQRWTKGLAEWDQDASRVARLKDSAEFTVFTPGSGAGVPVNILRSFDAPPPEAIDDRDAYRERVQTTATSLLALLRIEADPVRSREHILLSTILDHAWRAGRSMDLGSLVRAVQTPPPQLARIGVMDLEAFYPASERFGLAMALNNLIASPGFSAWSEGEPLNIGEMLYTPKGRPRVSIFSIAHLSDAERMFFVSMLLSEMLGWARRQSGTTSLRAILYMDEIAGYCPPVANPPSKGPLLTLMKQARAFGVGVVLATQNPVDLDYKGLSNAGTWFIGRLQTDRDKQRVLDGLEGAAAAAGGSLNRAELDRLLSGLKSRVFLMSNVHENQPVAFETRWCLSYLRGPMTREEIRRLTSLRGASGSPRVPGGHGAGEGLRAAPAPVSGGAASISGGPPPTPTPMGETVLAPANRPVLPPEIAQYFLPVRAERASESSRLLYHPRLLGLASIFYQDTRAGIDAEQNVSRLLEFSRGPVPVDWSGAEETDLDESDCEMQPGPGAAEFESLPVEATKGRSYETWRRDLADALFRSAKLTLQRCEAVGLVSKPGEAEREFRARLGQAAREKRDAAVERLRAKYAPKLQTLSERLRRAEQTVEVQREQARNAKMSTAVSFGSALLGAFLGKKAISAGNMSKAGSAVRGAGRSAKEAADVGRAEETAETVRRQIAELQAAFDEEAASVAASLDPALVELEEVILRPKKTNVKVRAVALVWGPMWVDAGKSTPAW